MLIAQISDLHVRAPGKQLYGRLDTAGYAERAVAAIAARTPAPDLVLVTGDLVDAGAADEYANLRRVLDALPMPYRLIPGNHDARDALRAAFPDHAYLAGAEGFICYTIEGFPLRLVALDSLDAGRVGGRLCEARLDWLDARLSEARDKPTMIFLHHVPFLTGVTHFDEAVFFGAEAFAAVVRRHPQVERVVAGHVHRSMSMRWAGTTFSTCPSTAHQFVLDLNPENHVDYALEPPGFQIHAWRAGQGLLTHTLPIGDYKVTRLR
ncbi:MAG: phosphodiesterase [Alphaproteobacteria bacterium]|nr:phosphodiesterase [Alphaproteobacteria bacterium]